MANNTNGNQFRDDESLVLDQLRDGKSVKNIFPKIGGRLRLAHEENDQLSISTQIIKYDENLAVVKAVTSTMKGNFPGLGMADKDTQIKTKYYAWIPKETRNDGSAMMRAYESVHCGRIKKPI